MKTCSKCKAEKPVTEFHKRERSKDGLQPHCKGCVAAHHAAAYAADPGKFLARNAATRATDPRRYYAGNLAWAKANHGRMNAHEAKRNAAKLRATPAWADPKAVKFIYAKAYETGAHVDHVVPLRSKLVCGLHVEHNLQLLTKSENSKKGNRLWPDMP